MKRCPTCNRTFLDEQLGYCTDDGTPLVDQQQSSTFDPQATTIDPPRPATNNIGTPGVTRPFRPGEMPGGAPEPYSWAEPRVSAPIAPATPWTPPSSQPAQWNPPPPPGGKFAATKPQFNPVAIASLAIGVFSLTIGLCCYLGVGTGPVAVILGVVAMVQLKNSPAQTQSASKGMAIAGIATGAVAFVLILLFLILGIAFGSFR
jgi:hypothetical protein